MSRSDDRITVQSNGHKPPLETPPTDAASSPTASPPSRGPDLRIAVTPAQAAVGFGVVAWLILLLLGRRRRRG
jgi:MYXO-CTERM domain-containing protein